MDAREGVVAGVYLNVGSSNNTFSNITASNNSFSGIHLTLSSNNNTFSNITASNNSYGIWLENSSNNILSNSTVTNSTSADVYPTSNAQNNTFLNVSLNKSKISFGTCAPCNLTVKWYVRVNVTNDTMALEGAYANITDVNGALGMGDFATGADGLTNYSVISEYIASKSGSTVSNTSLNNHTINATFGYAHNVTSLNITGCWTINITMYRQDLDISFTVLLPSSGCTEGKGCTGGSCTACTRAWIETTDLAGAANEACVMPEGQTAGQAFYNFTNTGNVNLNWTIRLNQSLSGTFKLNITNSTNSCANSRQITTSFTEVEDGIPSGSSAYGWLYGEFINALYGNESTELNHTSQQS